MDLNCDTEGVNVSLLVPVSVSVGCSDTRAGLSTLSAPLPRQTGPTHLHGNLRIARQRTDTVDLRQQEETLKTETEDREVEPDQTGGRAL